MCVRREREGGREGGREIETCVPSEGVVDARAAREL
jgi:hypothetical protein